MRRRAEASHRLHNSRGSDGRSIACLAERAAHSRSRTSQCGLSSLLGRKRRRFSPLPTCMPPSPQLLKNPPPSRVSCSIFFFLLLFHFFFYFTPQLISLLLFFSLFPRRAIHLTFSSTFFCLAFLSALMHTLTRLPSRRRHVHVQWLG